MSEPAGSTWADKLAEPFTDDLIFYKPKPSCKACTAAQGRVCGQHTKVKCPRCHQSITSAHVDLAYVGHADVTGRLLRVDPYWEWQPAHHAVDKDVLLAAIATGSPQIVSSVIANSPPLLDQNGGMWMHLTVHDDDGREVTRLGYGDAAGKSGPDAMKEIIGDGLRNAGQRFGIARQLWSKGDRDEATIEQGDGKLRGSRAAKARSEPAPQEPAEGRADPAAGQPGAQELADLAMLFLKQRRTVAELQEKVYEVARAHRGWLTSPVSHPLTAGLQVSLSSVIREAKQALEVIEERAALQAAKAAGDG